MRHREHYNRVQKELADAGISPLNLVRSEARFLPSIIYADEHIGAAVYGIGQSGWCMIVATEKRVVYLDKKPLFTTKDILTYDIVSGVHSSKVGPFMAITLQTRNGAYPVKFVGRNSANIFMSYIESRRLNDNEYGRRMGRYHQEVTDDMTLRDIPNQQVIDYITGQSTGVLSTVDAPGLPSGAVVHYVMDEDGYIYILTKSASQKARNIMSNNKAALTIHETGSLLTAQLQAQATIETNQAKKEQIFHHVVKDIKYRESTKVPPVTSLREGYYIVIRLVPTSIIFTDYSKM